MFFKVHVHTCQVSKLTQWYAHATKPFANSAFQISNAIYHEHSVYHKVACEAQDLNDPKQ
jgi:hypothetical protein